MLAAKKPYRILNTLLITAAILMSGCSSAPVANLVEKKAMVETRIAEQFYQYPIADIFLDFYNSKDDPEAFFGKPISHAYTDPNTGSLTQYFENLRLETQVDERGRLSIAISDLGNKLYTPTEESMLIINDRCTHFGDNPIPVCHEFRNFYEQHQGAALFGEPISHVFSQNDRYYQYFTNVCLIWEPLGNVVSLAPLGEMYLNTKEPLRYTITDPGYPELMITEKDQADDLTVVYTVEHPFLHPHWEQTVSVYVTDKAGNYVPNASVTVWVILPGGQFEIYRPTDTNHQGISSFTIPALANSGVQRDDLVKLRIEVSSNGMTGQAIGWFRIWL